MDCDDLGLPCSRIWRSRECMDVEQARVLGEIIPRWNHALVFRITPRWTRLARASNLGLGYIECPQGSEPAKK